MIYVGGYSTLNIFDEGEVEHKFTVENPDENGAGLARVDDSLTENYQTFFGGYITGGYYYGYFGGSAIHV